MADSRNSLKPSRSVGDWHESLSEEEKNQIETVADMVATVALSARVRMKIKGPLVGIGLASGVLTSIAHFASSPDRAGEMLEDFIGLLEAGRDNCKRTVRVVQGLRAAAHPESKGVH